MTLLGIADEVVLSDSGNVDFVAIRRDVKERNDSSGGRKERRCPRDQKAVRRRLIASFPLRSASRITTPVSRNKDDELESARGTQ
jgi:hypothetical protein